MIITMIKNKKINDKEKGELLKWCRKEGENRWDPMDTLTLDRNMENSPVVTGW